MSTSDELNSLNHTGDRPDELDPPDADLHHRLLSDGAQWRAGLPSAETLAARVASLERPDAGEIDRRREDTAVTDRIPPAVTDRPLTPTPAPPHHGPWMGLRGAVAGAMALAVVVMFVLVIHGAPGAGTTAENGRPAPTGKATATQTDLARGQWVTMLGLSNLPSMPVIAPSDPDVVYTLDGATLKRSDNDGATWKSLAPPSSIPATASFTWLDLFVSPVNANTIFATLSANVNGACVASSGQPHVGALAARRGSPSCSSQYVSTDGGQTWKALSIAGDDTLRLGNLNAPRASASPYSAAPQIQKGALYSLAGYGPQAIGPGYRIVRSTDDGLTWQTIDAGLTTRGLNICDYAASDTGNRLYAIVSEKQACSFDQPPPVQLWRSDDGGANWQLIDLPAQGLDEGMVVTSGTLYIAMGTPSGQSHMGGATVGATSFLATSDGGRTWKTSPAQGPANGATAPYMAVTGARGGVIAAFTSASNGQATSGSGWPEFYGWIAGEPYWKPTPQAPLSAPTVTTVLATTDAKTGELTLWVVTPGQPPAGQTSGPLTYIVYRCQL